MFFIMSGKKQSGKSSGCYHLFNLYQKYKNQSGPDYFIKPNGNIISDNDKFNGLNIEKHKPFLDEFFKESNCKIYSFADFLKKNVCIDILGLDPECVYGDNEMKGRPTDIYWDAFPDSIQKNFRRQDLKNNTKIRMSHRQVMEVVGSAIFRAMKPDCWMTATYNLLKSEQYPFALISDARFPNEVSSGTEIGGIAIRLTRQIETDDQSPSETALDFFPLAEYNHIINNHGEDKDFKDNELEKIFLSYLK